MLGSWLYPDIRSGGPERAYHQQTHVPVLTIPRYTGSTACVASSNETYQKSWFSNYGPNVMIIAPGSNITAASIQGDNYITTKSGTSMASPFVAGVMANFVSFEGLWDDVPSVWKRLRSNQLNDIIGGFPAGAGNQTTNAFLNNGINNPSKRSIDPYAGIPRDELKLALAAEAAVTTSSGNAASAAAVPFPIFCPNGTCHEHLTDTGGPTATITTESDTLVDIWEQPTETAAPVDGDYGFEGDFGVDDGTSVGTTITTSGAPITTSGAPITTSGAPITTSVAPITTSA